MKVEIIFWCVMFFYIFPAGCAAAAFSTNGSELTLAIGKAILWPAFAIRIVIIGIYQAVMELIDGND